jgi:hypothetical protein
MGHLYFFNLEYLIDHYKTPVFFETGTGFGFGVYHATQFSFETIISCDVVKTEIDRLNGAFDPRVKLFAGASPDVLRQLLPQISKPILFWLDAHFPGAHHGASRYDAIDDEALRLPLRKELEMIRQLRPMGKDVILIDDLRIYEHDKFEAGNLADVGLSHIGSSEDSSFLYTMFEDTHEAHRSLKHTGYLALLPKEQLEAPASSSPAPATASEPPRAPDAAGPST